MFPFRRFQPSTGINRTRKQDPMIPLQKTELEIF